MYDVGAMSNDEQDRIVGAVFNRLRAAQKHEQCLRSKLNQIASDYRRTAEAITSRGSMPYVDGDQLRVPRENLDPPVHLWDRQTIEDTLTAYAAAARESTEADTDWQAHQSS